jgi:hypothetical protein
MRHVVVVSVIEHLHYFVTVADKNELAVIIRLLWNDWDHTCTPGAFLGRSSK